MTKTPEEKKDALANAGAGEGDGGKKPRRRRTIGTPSKAELLAKVEQFEAEQKERSEFPPITPEQLSLTTQGLLMIAEGLSNLPFGDVDKKLVAGFNESAAACINHYMPGAYFKYIPLMQLANSLALITLDAVDKGRKKKQRKQRELPPPEDKQK